MNLKNVLRTYTLLRQLTDDESALLQTLNSLSEGEREQLVESLSPTKGTGKGVKREPRTGTKSPRATSLAEQIKSTSKSKPADDGECMHQFSNGELCSESPSSGIHDPAMGYQNYHEFQPAQAAAATGD